MDFAPIIENMPLYLQGLGLTIKFLIISLIVGFILSVPIALGAASSIKLLSAPAKTFIYVWRGTPLLIQIYMIYHGMAQFDFVREGVLWVIFKEAYWCALIAFVLNTAAYTAEIIRGAIVQTPRGEIEAAKAMGMSDFNLYKRIILPSAFRRALPAYGNEAIFMLHGTALAGVITLIDLFGAARIVNSRHFIPFESYIAAGLFYLALTFAMVWLFKKLEKHWLKHLNPNAQPSSTAWSKLKSMTANLRS